MFPVRVVFVESDYAWAAGFFDGEGTTSVLKAQRDKYSYIRMGISQKDPECLYRFQAVFNLGKIYKSNTRDIYSWNCYKYNDVLDVYTKMKPFLSNVKQRQFEVALNTVKENTHDS